MNLDLSNKTAIVCGSTQGIGLATATELSQLGANCILIARNEEKLRKAINELDSSKGQQHNYLVADFSDPDGLKLILEKGLNGKSVNILINNTGGPAGGPANTATTSGVSFRF